MYKLIGQFTVVFLILSVFTLTVYVISSSLNDMDIKGIILVSVLLIMSTGIYKKCNRLNPKRNVHGFIRQYWADMKCTYLTVFFALIGVFIGILIINTF